MKMAEKRAHVDSILRTTAASGIFTQDRRIHVMATGKGWLVGASSVSSSTVSAVPVADRYTGR